MNHESVCHRWANQQPNGRTKELEAKGGSIFYVGKTIYSYGYHYPMGHLYNGTAYINNAGYSVTTSKHIRYATSAVNPSTHKTFYVPTTGLMDRVLYAKTPLEIRKIKIACKLYHIAPALAEFKKRTKRLKLDRYQIVLGLMNNVRKLQGKTPLLGNVIREKTFETWKNDYANSADERAAKATKRRFKKDRVQGLTEFKGKLKRAFLFSDPSCKIWDKNPISLKIDGNRVKTSNGAEVSLKSAKTLLKVWHKATKARKTFSNKEMNVDGIKGVCIRGNGTVKIGCTRILPDAVQKLALELA